MFKNILFLISAIFLFSSCGEDDRIYISPLGSDNNPGTREAPLATVHKALEQIRDMSIKPEIILDEGTYYFEEPLILEPSHSGTEENPLVIQSEEGKEVRISGGKRLNLNWQEYRDGIFKASIAEGDFEQLFVNGEKQHLARYPDFKKNEYPFNGWAADAIDPERVKTWKDPIGGYLHALHSGRWGGFHYRITGKKDAEKLELEGGWQNNRPSQMHSEFRFVENIFEELDAPGEWYLDSKAKVLYFYPPENIDLDSAVVDVSILDNLIEFRGSHSNPVHDVVLEGISFTQTQRSFMKTKEPLLRSDWTIFRGGAVLLEGTERIAVKNSVFEQLGGNAIFISRYNRKARVTGNIIRNIGASAISFVGDPEAVRSPSFQYHKFVPANEIDTVPGPKTANYPTECLVENNLIHHIGRVEKQVAGVQLSMASNIEILHNTIYHVPRAGINISDGTWGGHLIAYNDVFKTVLETSDHGAFNSWGRDRFWHSDRIIMDSLVKAHPDWPLLDAISTNVIHSNRFRCDNGWDIDLDDGSSNYRIYNNLCLSGGIKLREGFHRTVENNITINNGLHPHVWFRQSHDTIRHNIFMRSINDIRLQGWGDFGDYNFYTDSTDLAHAHSKGIGSHSIAGNPQFVAPEEGNYTVERGSPAFEIGFENFHMDQYGVTSEKLKKLAAIPDFPKLVMSSGLTEGMTLNWLGTTIKSVETLGEQSAAGLKSMEGVLVLQVKDGSAGGNAGLLAGDVILKLNDIDTPDVYTLFRTYQGEKWREELSLEIYRNQTSEKLAISNH